MEPSEAERTIIDVDRLRRSTRHALNPVWFPNIAFGLFFAGTAAVGFLDLSNTPASLYWVFGGGLTIWLVVRYYAQRERELGVTSPMLDASTVVLLGLLAGVVAANLLTEGDVNGYAPAYAGAAGTFAMGLVLRDRIECAAAVAIALVATAVALTGPDEPGSWANLGVGLSLLVAGLVGRERA